MTNVALALFDAYTNYMLAMASLQRATMAYAVEYSPLAFLTGYTRTRSERAVTGVTESHFGEHRVIRIAFGP